jgi:hypothetical protein
METLGAFTSPLIPVFCANLHQVVSSTLHREDCCTKVEEKTAGWYVASSHLEATPSCLLLQMRTPQKT